MPAWVAASCAGVAVAAAGVLTVGRWPAAGAWMLVTGAVIGHWAGRRASDCGVLAALDGTAVAQLAVPPARVAACSVTPIADLARIRAAGCGVVNVAGDNRVLPAERIDRYEVDLLLCGRWDRLAVPAAELAGATPVDLLTRLPDEDETWLVRTPTAMLALRGEHLRAAAMRVVRERRTSGDRARWTPRTSAPPAARGRRVPARGASR